MKSQEAEERLYYLKNNVNDKVEHSSLENVQDVHYLLNRMCEICLITHITTE